jgi:hypothetical protein
MRDGDKEVACRVSLEALTNRGAATGLNEASAFEACRHEIEQAASEKYDCGQTDYTGGVYVTSVEFPPAPRT